jgi:hypothetical protein
MEPRFELHSDEHGRYSFTLKGPDGNTLLMGLKCDGRIPVGIEVVNVRKSVRDIRNMVAHLADDGAFVVLKSSSGEVLGRSPHVPRAMLKVLAARIQEMAPISEIHDIHAHSSFH